MANAGQAGSFPEQQNELPTVAGPHQVPETKSAAAGSG